MKKPTDMRKTSSDKMGFRNVVDCKKEDKTKLKDTVGKCFIHDLSKHTENAKYIMLTIQTYPFIERSIFCESCLSTGIIHIGFMNCQYWLECQRLEKLKKPTHHLYKF